MKQIFEPVKLNHMELKNRLVRSATWEGIANLDGSVTEEAYEIYEESGSRRWYFKTGSGMETYVIPFIKAKSFFSAEYTSGSYLYQT